MLHIHMTSNQFYVTWRGSVASLSMSLSTYTAIFICLIGNIWPEVYYKNILFIITTLQTARLCLRGFSSSIDIAIGTSFLALYFILAPNIFLFDGTDPSLTVAIFIMFSDTMRRWGSETPPLTDKTKGETLYHWIGFLTSISLIAILFYAIPKPDIALLMPVGVALFYQEAMLRHGQSKRNAWTVFLLFEASIFAYMTLHWTGFGRLSIAAMLVMPFALLSTYYPTFIRFWHLAATLPFLMILAIKVRGGSVEQLTTMAAVGITDHLRFTSDLMKKKLQGDVGIDTFIEQFCLLFLNWFPRDLWPEKPVGAGYYSVDLMLSRFLYGDEHSISLGFIGDQIFALGEFYLTGLFLVLVALIATRRFLIKVTHGRRAAIVAFDCTMLTYFWGGMAAFGSRAWFMIIPIIALSLAHSLAIRMNKLHLEPYKSQWQS